METWPTIEGIIDIAATRHEHTGDPVPIIDVTQLSHDRFRVTLICGCWFECSADHAPEIGQTMDLTVNVTRPTS